MNFEPVIEDLPLLLQGLVVTLIASALALVLALAIGVVLGTVFLLPISSLRRLIRLYVYFFRGTPLLVLLFLAYFALPQVGLNISAFAAGVLALGLNSGAYVAEVVRSALQSIDKEQHEAAALDGAKPYQTLVRIIFPQALLQMVAPTTNEMVSLVKNSSLLAVIAVAELTRAAQLISGRAFVPFEVYLTIAVVYLAINSLLTRMSQWFEDTLVQP